MTDHDPTIRSTRNGLADDDIYLTREYVERALYQFPSEEERVLLTGPRPPQNKGPHRTGGDAFFEHDRARWSARTHKEPDLSVLLIKTDRQRYRRALGAAAAVALGASMLALITRSPLLVTSSPSPRPFHVSEMSARQPPPEPTIDRQTGSRPVEDAPSLTASLTPSRSPATVRISARPPERARISRAVAMPATDFPKPQPAVLPDAAQPLPDPPAIAVHALSTPIDRGDVRLDAAPGRPLEPRPTPDLTATATTRPASAPSNVAPSAPAIDERQSIHRVLGQYAAAFSRLDATAAKAVWPQVDRRALERGFSQLERQTVALSNCTVLVNSGQATAQCRGQATYVPKVGNRAERTENRNWQFDLRKSGDSWIIARVDSR